MSSNSSFIKESADAKGDWKDGDGRYDSLSDLPFKMALPMVAVGTFVLALSLAFCCYLMKKRTRGRSRGYRKVIVSRNDKGNSLETLKNDACAICLEDFKVKDVLAICPCEHAFHKKCLVKWLKLRKTCPMCMTQITVSYHQSYVVGHASVTITLNQPPENAI